eukprot:scaffold1822_cov333-Pavlova_lutheri.AAC.1
MILLPMPETSYCFHPSWPRNGRNSYTTSGAVRYSSPQKSYVVPLKSLYSSLAVNRDGKQS